MGKIAILDTDICGRDLHCNTFRQYKVRNGTTGCSDMEEFSYGTVCAMLLDRNTTNYDLVSVPVLENEPGDGGKPWGSIERGTAVVQGFCCVGMTGEACIP